jgi:predicted phosphodiesterase
MKKNIVAIALIALLAGCARAPSISTKPFKLVIVPDSQYLSTNDFSAQMLFVETNAEVVAMLHVGDVVDAPTEAEWNKKMPGLTILTNKPFLLCAGNHDYDQMLHTNDERALTVWNTHVPQSLYTRKPWWNGEFYSNSSENCCFTLTNGGVKMLLCAVEFGPRTNVLRWVAAKAAEHPDHLVILVTHSYLMPDATRNKAGDYYNPHGYGLRDATDGEEMWQQIKGIPNLGAVVCGHQLGWPHVAHSSDRGVHGNVVQQFFADWQETSTGNLEIWTVIPNRRRVLVETYSPVSGTYDRSMTNEFAFPFTAIPR